MLNLLVLRKNRSQLKGWPMKNGVPICYSPFAGCLFSPGPRWSCRLLCLTAAMKISVEKGVWGSVWHESIWMPGFRALITSGYKGRENKWGGTLQVWSESFQDISPILNLQVRWLSCSGSWSAPDMEFETRIKVMAPLSAPCVVWYLRFI